MNRKIIIAALIIQSIIFLLTLLATIDAYTPVYEAKDAYIIYNNTIKNGLDISDSRTHGIYSVNIQNATRLFKGKLNFLLIETVLLFTTIVLSLLEFLSLDM